jgi:hypothetical protein
MLFNTAIDGKLRGCDLVRMRATAAFRDRSFENNGPDEWQLRAPSGHSLMCCSALHTPVRASYGSAAPAKTM